MQFMQIVPDNSIKSLFIGSACNLTVEQMQAVSDYLSNNYFIRKCTFGMQDLLPIVLRNKYVAKQSRFKRVKPV